MSDTFDAIPLLAKISGLPEAEVRNIAAQVLADKAKADACPQHRYEGAAIVKLGQKFPCLECGVVFGLLKVGQHVRKAEAAGLDANAIFPGWSR